METTILEDVGLSKREAKAYLVLLKLGSSTIGEVVKQTEIPSSKIYEVLDRLMAKGLVSYIIKKHQKNFQAADPEMILSSFEERKKQFEKLLPSLKETQKLANDKQEVELYEGKQAVFKAIRHLVEKARKNDEWLSFTVGTEHDNPEMASFYSNLSWRRKEKGLITKVLANEKTRQLANKHYSKDLIKTIQLKFTTFNFPQGIMIINNKLIMLNWKNKATAIIITSQNISDQYKDFFYELYNHAKP
jgi:HTH-type transcriptional regulator, sugar sensing transcriptional regulator